MTGATLKAFREQRMGYTQAQLADALGISRKTLGTYEAEPDKPVPRVVVLACAALALFAPPVV
jgi:DNA-binding XRE family transcriptional regulator